MAETREYKMTISLRRVKSDTNGSSSDGEETKPTSVTDTLKKVIKQSKSVAAATGVGMVATQALNYVSSRVEIETGNSRVQGQINAAKQIGSQVASVAMAGLFGGTAGAGLALLGIGMSYVTDYMSYDFDKRQNDAMLEIQRERAGLAWAANTQRRL